MPTALYLDRHPASQHWSAINASDPWRQEFLHDSFNLVNVFCFMIKNQ
jgi:hypothetical protein